jgi:glycosyltransferase EpsE
MKPLVSIILPTHNGEHYIAQAIKSVLKQSYDHWELLIINDGSTDQTKDIIERYVKQDSRIIYIENEHNLGIQKTLNRGIALAKGTYLARLDDDDQWIKDNKLEQQVSFLENNQEYVLVGTDALVVDASGVTRSVNTMPKTDAHIRANMLSKNCFLHATIMARKDAVEKAGGYSEHGTTLHAEDYDLWLRVGKIGKMTNLNMISTKLTAREGSLTSAHRVMQARHVFSCMVRHHKGYPRVIKGYITSLARIVFFFVFSIIPLPKKILYAVQRMYRSI